MMKSFTKIDEQKQPGGLWKAGLVVHKIESTVHKNLDKIVHFIEVASQNNAHLVLFSETALTGLTNCDDPVHDMQLSFPIPGKVTHILCKAALDSNIHVGLGLFERVKKSLYDTAILINKNGKIVLTYRRISKGWHWPDSDPSIYQSGKNIPSALTEFGKVCFLLCGDLFDDSLLSQIKIMKPDLLLLPMARTIEDSSNQEETWEKEELPAYADRIKSLGVTTFMTGYHNEDYIGGATAFSRNGEVLSRLIIHQEGILFVPFGSGT